MPDIPNVSDFVPALRCLDHLLNKAVVVSRTRTDAFRGLYISEADVDELLAREPGSLLWRAEDLDPAPGEMAQRISEIRPFSRIAEIYQLAPFDLCVLLIALAPELDLRYESLFAYLHDNVTRKRPSIDLVLNLLCATPAERITGRVHFASEAPLFAHRLVHLIEDPGYPNPSLLAYALRLDDQAVNFIIGQRVLDRRLASFSENIVSTVSTPNLSLSRDTIDTLHVLARDARSAGNPLMFYFCGPPGAEKRGAAESIAAILGVPLLAVDLSRAIKQEETLEQVTAVLTREATLWDIVLYLDNVDAIVRSEHAHGLYGLLGQLTRCPGPVVLAGVRESISITEDLLQPPMDIIQVQFPVPDHPQRLSAWCACLAEAEIELPEADLNSLAGRFRLTPGQIRQTVTAARSNAVWRQAHGDAVTGSPGLVDLFKAARVQSILDLGPLAHKIDPLYTWNDIVLPDDSLAQLRELCQRTIHQYRVFAQWGFDRKLSLGKGIAALFSGPSGTGKTMAAEIIAAELGLDLYRIDLAGVVSKYIGETEKNLDRIFSAAENSNAILFFDEADAIFGKRSEVRDSHDRYANIEISYLLQKMEQYEGVTILATNLRQNMDDAFMRRLTFVIHFPFPDETSRLRIWEGIWPAEIPLGADVNLDFMARQFKLSGGNIKNVALSASFLAAADGGQVTMAHLFHATQREYQKLGKDLSEADLYGSWRSAD